MRPGAIGEVYGCSMDPIRRILIEQKALRNLNKIPAKYDNRRGEKNTSWKGGVKTEIQIMYDSFEYKEFRKMIYKRDDYTCQFCGARGTKRLHCHHIYPVRDYPELFLVESNAITLCSNCHASTIGNEYQFERRCLEALS
jgi:5-methylcytosine-specific restriction endonuclease McrA